MKQWWAEKIAPRLRLAGRWLLRQRRRAGCALALLAAGLAGLLLWPMDKEAYLCLHPSGEMQDRSGRLMYAFLNPQGQWCFGRELNEISPLLIKATLATEDHRFYHHPGIDPLATLRAMGQNLARRRVVSGASTLTMQVVKQAGRPSDSLWGKLCQAASALRLERRASKNEILKAYLNSAPYGLNLIGCEAAARRYFGKPSLELTLSEAALIAGLPKGPTSLMPLKHPRAARRRRNHVLRRMLEEKCIARDEYLKAAAEPLGAYWQSFPDLSPHLAMRLKPAITSRGRLSTTLERDIQAQAERLIHQQPFNFEGEIGNTAMVVLDVPTATVLAHVGSAEFFDEKKKGQYDATRAARSPGSALKPFTYALAMEQNCLYACETLLDDSADYGLFNPENMDHIFHGLVSAEGALKRSLNVPAVTVLDRVGTANLYWFLHELNFATLTRPAEFYGLGLTLGSCEVRLEDLAAAYCMLANLGQYRRLGFLGGGVERPLKSCLSRGTCLKIYEMLEQPLPHETYHETGEVLNATTRVCWKTGTSWGHHDAWAVVFNRQYLVAVWMGNNNATPSRYLIGAQSALPLAGRMFRLLRPGNGPSWPSPERDLHEVPICALSGLPASPWCFKTKTAWLPREQFLNRVCDMHYPDPDAPAGAAGPGQVTERWPGSARAWDLAKITSVLNPKRKTRQPGDARLDALTIKTPANHAQFVLTGAEGGDRIRLATSVDEQTLLYWYLDEEFIGAADPVNPLLLDLKPGRHKLVCMTPQGLTDQVQFEVLDESALNASSTPSTRP